MKINHRYFKLPIANKLKPRSLCLYENGKLVFDLSVSLCPENPDDYYYADLREFLNRNIDFRILPNIGFFPELVDKVPVPDPHWLDFLPAVHFHTLRGWMNDPNGLVYYEGKYHLFFQHNPVGSNWGNMHWGHAVSSDLYHWEEKEIAFFPDETGTVFSGCAVVDFENRSGLRENEHDPLLLFYTAAGGTSEFSRGKPFTQCLAYSLDGGKTFRKYAGNPIIPRICDGNRDPKVIWDGDADIWRMALYLIGNSFALLSSDNLLDWRQTQEIILPEDLECSDLYPLTCEDDGKKYWIFSAASDWYLIGEFSDGKYMPLQPAKRLSYDSKGYASQTFSSAGGHTGIRIAWNRSHTPSALSDCSMTSPVKMSLRRINGEFALCADPLPFLSSIVAQKSEETGLSASTDNPLVRPLPETACLIELSMDKTDVTLSFYGLDAEIRASDKTINFCDGTMPLNDENGEVRLTVVVDRSSTEVFCGGAVRAVSHLQDFTKNMLTVIGNCNINRLSISSLQL